MLVLWEKLEKGYRSTTKYAAKKGFRLNLGCGDEIPSLYVNGDKKKSLGVEILLDLDHPLPFKSDSVDEVRIVGVIGHLKHPLKIRNEIDRILKDGGEAVIGSCTCPSLHRHNVGGRYRKNVFREKRIYQRHISASEWLKMVESGADVSKVQPDMNIQGTAEVKT